MDTLIDILHQGGYSCVIRKGGDTRTYCQRGVADLWQLCHDGEHFLQGAHIADKVIGKGAAALMIRGGACEVYADVISHPALARGDGLCPVETLCVDLTTIDDMVDAISNFINKLK